jgi:hypothetical protein
MSRSLDEAAGIEPGYSCDNSSPPSVCTRVAACGDGFIDGGEACDPPDGVTCDDQCQFVPEPGAVVLQATALAVLFLLARRRGRGRPGIRSYGAGG